MAGKPQTFRQLIELWPKKTHFAATMMASRGRVDDWYRRNRIPSIYWPSIIRAVRKFGFQLNGDDMLKIQEKSGHVDQVTRSRRMGS